MQDNQNQSKRGRKHAGMLMVYDLILLLLTDLMDHQIEIPGTLDYANLVDGYVIVKGD